MDLSLPRSRAWDCEEKRCCFGHSTVDYTVFFTEPARPFYRHAGKREEKSDGQYSKIICLPRRKLSPLSNMELRLTVDSRHTTDVLVFAQLDSGGWPQTLLPDTDMIQAPTLVPLWPHPVPSGPSLRFGGT